MSQGDNKRKYRELKRELKKDGKKKRRYQLRDELRKNPGEAHLGDEVNYGRSSSQILNGMDEAENRRRQRLKEARLGKDKAR